MEADKQVKKWIRQIKRNPDKKAANSLVKAYYREMLGYVYNRSNDKEVAMDITQEIFVSMLKSINNFDETKSSFRTWLYAIASRRVADYYRSTAYKNSLLNEPDEAMANEASDFKMDKAIELNEINLFLDDLDETKQRIFRLKVFDDYTFSRIAEELELPESTVKTSFYATQKLIRKEFGDNG